MILVRGKLQVICLALKRKSARYNSKNNLSLQEGAKSHTVPLQKSYFQ
jgi:hypothetical protein